MSLSSDHTTAAHTLAVATFETLRQTARENYEDAQTAMREAEQVSNQDETILNDLRVALKRVRRSRPWQMCNQVPVGVDGVPVCWCRPLWSVDASTDVCRLRGAPFRLAAVP